MFITIETTVGFILPSESQSADEWYRNQDVDKWVDCSNTTTVRSFKRIESYYTPTLDVDPIKVGEE